MDTSFFYDNISGQPTQKKAQFLEKGRAPLLEPDPN